jgi:hypothetical protein
MEGNQFSTVALNGYDILDNAERMAEKFHLLTPVMQIPDNCFALETKF